MRYFGFLLCFLVSGCVTASSQSPSASSKRLDPYTLSKEDILAVQKGVRAILKDPDSARFGKMVAGSDGSGAVTVCLMVNAKNSFGGYTGEKPYMGILSKPPRVFFANTDSNPGNIQYRDRATMTVCDQYGLSL